MSALEEQSDEVFCVWCGQNQDNCECEFEFSDWIHNLVEEDDE